MGSFGGRQLLRGLMVFAGVTVGVGAFAGCGGTTTGGAGGSCAAIDACGGDITGTWRITALCSQVTPSSAGFGGGLPPACSGALAGALTNDQVTVLGGTITFTNDGHYTETGSMRVTANATYSAECIAALGVPNAASFCGAASMVGLDGGTSACQVVGTGCECTITETQPLSESGSYQVQGTELVMQGRGASFCVKGSSASISVSGSVADAGPISTFSGRIDLQR